MNRYSKKNWDDILMSKNVKSQLDELVSNGTMEEIFPEVYDIVPFGDGKLHKRLWPHTKQVIVQCKDNLTLRWTALFHDIGKPKTIKILGKEVSFHGHETLGARMFEKAAKRTGLWKNDKKQMSDIKWLIANSGRADYNERWTDSAVRRLVRESGERLDLALDFTLADQTTSKKEYRKRNFERIAHLKNRIHEMDEAEKAKICLPKGLGNAIINELGAKGANIGTIMNIAKKAIESGTIENSRDIIYYMSFIKTALQEKGDNLSL